MSGAKEEALPESQCLAIVSRPTGEGEGFMAAQHHPTRLLQWGLVQWYALVMVAGMLGFVFYYAYR